MIKAISQRELDQLEIDMRAMVNQYGDVQVTTQRGYLPYVQRIARRIGTPLHATLQEIDWNDAPIIEDFFILMCCYYGKGTNQNRPDHWNIYFPVGTIVKFKIAALTGLTFQ